MSRANPPIPRLRVLKDLDSDEVYIGEWFPSLEHDEEFLFRLWEGRFVDEDHAREAIKEILYD